MLYKGPKKSWIYILLYWGLEFCPRHEILQTGTILKCILTGFKRHLPAFRNVSFLSSSFGENVWFYVFVSVSSTCKDTHLLSNFSSPACGSVCLSQSRRTQRATPAHRWRSGDAAVQPLLRCRALPSPQRRREVKVQHRRMFWRPAVTNCPEETFL